MRFYILQDASGESIANERVEPGASPNLTHEEFELPPNFFISLPEGLLTRRIDNAENKDIDRIFTLTHGNPIAEGGFVATKQNLMALGYIQLRYRDHFYYIPDLTKVILKTQKVKAPNTMTVLNGRSDEFHYQNQEMTAGASYETLANAIKEMKAEKSILVGYSGYVGRPAMLFIAKDATAAQQMLLSSRMRDGSALRQYTHWHWYVTNNLQSLMQYLLDLLARHSLKDQLSFISEEGDLLYPQSYGKALLETLSTCFGIDLQLNIGGQTGVELLALIHNYVDHRKVSVCDLYLTYGTLSSKQVKSLAISSDKAYVRAGLCGFQALDESPLNKFLTSKPLMEIEEKKHETLLRKLPRPVKQLYLLAPEGLYYIPELDEEKPIGQQHLVSSDPAQVESVWNFIRAFYPKGVKHPNSQLTLIGSFVEEVIARETKHQRKYPDQFFFINKSTNELIELKLHGDNNSQDSWLRLDATLEINSHSPETRILSFEELRRIKRLTDHDCIDIALPAPELILEMEAKAVAQQKMVVKREIVVTDLAGSMKAGEYERLQRILRPYSAAETLALLKEANIVTILKGTFATKNVDKYRQLLDLVDNDSLLPLQLELEQTMVVKKASGPTLTNTKNKDLCEAAKKKYAEMRHYFRLQAPKSQASPPPPT